MNKVILSFLSLFLFSSISLLGQTAVSSGDGTLRAAIEAAADGDILELETGGVYTETTDSNFAVLIDKNITIQAEPSDFDDKPTLKLEGSGSRVFFRMGNNSGLALRGLIVDGDFDGNWAANLCEFYLEPIPELITVNTIRLENCEFMNFDDNFIDGQGSDITGYVLVDSLIVDDCIVHHSGTVVHFKDAAANYIQLTNSTFYEISSYGIRIRGAEYIPLPNTATVYIDHTTWDMIGTTDPREVLLGEDGIANPWTVTNSIFSRQVGTGSRTIINIKETPAAPDDSLATITNCAFWVYDQFSWKMHTVLDTVTGVDPEFLDPDNGDFTLPTNHLFLNFASEGGPIGDPRWGTNPTGVVKEDILPNKFDLSQNYPNPFNPVTLINFVIPNDGFVSLKVYDILGSEVAVLLNERMNSGSYKVDFDASNLPSGIYLYKLNSSGQTITRKMVLMK